MRGTYNKKVKKYLTLQLFLYMIMNLDEIKLHFAQVINCSQNCIKTVL